MIVETDASEYALTTILSIIIEEMEVHLVTFHSCIFKAVKLNYDTYDKELLVVFEAFHIWCHYLEKSEILIDVIMDHKNLKYFLTTKILFYYQARWSEFLSQFNLIICFYLGHLESKPDTITCKEGLYPRKERAIYNSVNSQNICSIFTYSQLVTSL